MGKIVVVGLGPAGSELITSQSLEELHGMAPVYLRTKQHPAAVVVDNAHSFDHLYETEQTFEAVYQRIVETLVEAAKDHGKVVYAVPGSPTVAETTITLLRQNTEVELEVQSAVSFLDLAWSALEVDPHELGVQLVDGHQFAQIRNGGPGPFLVGQCDSEFVLSDIKLAYEDQSPSHAVVLQRLGMSTQSVTTLPWAELDRAIEPDIFTTVWIPAVQSPGQLNRLEEITRHLRDECPWDRDQTHQSLSRHLIEECYELVDAIEDWSDDNTSSEIDLIEELGDVLIQVFVHAAVASSAGRFNITDIAQVAADKLVQRHPHVYGDAAAETADDVMSGWEANKKAVKARDSVMDGIPRQLPALLYAAKVLSKAARCGIAPDHHDGNVGARLFALADEARGVGDDPESVLRVAVNDFRQRFELAEAAAAKDGVDLIASAPAIAAKYWTAQA